MLEEVADGAAGLVDHRAFAQPIEGVRDLAEHAGLARVEELLAPTSPLGRAAARARERAATPSCAPRTPPCCGPLWDEVVTLVSGKLVFRD